MEKFAVSYANISFLRRDYGFLAECVSRTSKRIYIKLNFENTQFEKISRKDLLAAISEIYGNVLKVDLMSDPIVLLPQSKNVLEGKDINAIFLNKNENELPHSNSAVVVRIEDAKEDIVDYLGSLGEEEEEKYKRVALGGTFDHFHSGHKILLTSAVLLATNEVIVGVSDGDLLKNKKFKEVMQSYEFRKNVITNFLTVLNSSLSYSVPQLLDVAGPTLSDPDIDALSVSEETLSGAAFINAEREKKGWKQLAVVVIPLVSNHSSLGSDIKLSSTSLRQLEYEAMMKNQEQNIS